MIVGYCNFSPKCKYFISKGVNLYQESALMWFLLVMRKQILPVRMDPPHCLTTRVLFEALEKLVRQQ